MILFNFDVIARPAETLALRQPDPDGRRLWLMFYDRYMGRVGVIVNEDYPKDQLETWLKTEAFKPTFVEVFDSLEPDHKAQKVHKVSAIYGKAAWYLDVDPRTVARTMAMGIPSMVVACPYVVRPEWLEEPLPRAWDELVAEMNTQALKAAEKTWSE